MAISNVPPKSASPNVSTRAEWRCLECGKLLGVRRGAKLQVRVQGHDYLVSLPVEACCRGCGTHNQT
jgi:hypothetical protein